MVVVENNYFWHITIDSLLHYVILCIADILAPNESYYRTSYPKSYVDAQNWMARLNGPDWMA